MSILPNGPSVQVPVPQGGPPVQASKGFPWGKALVGCGCATILACLVVGVAGFMVYQQGAKKFETVRAEMERAEQTERERVAQGLGAQDRTGAASPTGTADPEQSARQKSSKALEGKQIRLYLDKPLTVQEVRAFNKFLAEWRKNPAYVKSERQSESIKRLGEKKDDSMLGQMKAAREVSKTTFALRDLAIAFEQHVQQNGGYEVHYSRTVRIAGALAAAQAVAKQHKIEDHLSNEVAKLVLKEQPAIAKEYRETIAEARAASKNAKDGQDRVAMQSIMALSAGGPGAIAMGRMPLATFQTWDKLSPRERKELEDNLGLALGVSSWFGMPVNAAVLLPSALLTEFEDLK